MTLGSLREPNELRIVMPRAVWQGSHSLWRVLRSLRSMGMRHLCETSRVIERESARKKGEVEKLIEWDVSSYIISDTVK